MNWMNGRRHQKRYMEQPKQKNIPGTGLDEKRDMFRKLFNPLRSGAGLNAGRREKFIISAVAKVCPDFLGIYVEDIRQINFVTNRQGMERIMEKSGFSHEDDSLVQTVQLTAKGDKMWGKLTDYSIF